MNTARLMARSIGAPAFAALMVSVGCSTTSDSGSDAVAVDSDAVGQTDSDIASPTDASADDEGTGAGGEDLGQPDTHDTSTHPLGQDGTRLHALFHTASGVTGANYENGVPFAWHDTLLNVDCHFVEGPGGVYRCFPLESGGLHVFSTATCEPGTDLLARLVNEGPNGTPSCSIGYVWYGFEDTQCAPNTRGHALKLGGAVTASLASHGYISTVFDACNKRPAAPPPPDPGPQWVYCAVEEVADTEFVAATAEIRAVGSVRQLVLHGDDGSVELHSLLHPDADVRVYRDWFHGTELIADGLNVSIGNGPIANPECGYFTACESEGAPTCARAMVVASECSGAAFPLVQTTTTGPTCDGSEPAPGANTCFLAPGPEMAHIAYEELHLGDGRLRPIWVAHQGQPLMPSGFFWDETQKTSCYPESDREGVIRCLPNSSAPCPGHPKGWRRAYSAVLPNGQCDQPVGFVYQPKCDEPTPLYAWVAAKRMAMSASATPVPNTLYSGVGPPGDEKYGCEPLPFAPNTLFEGVEVPDSAFAEMEQRSAP